MTLQITSGVLLSFYFVRASMAWDSVVELTREVSLGWLLRVVHSNLASFLFILIFIHFLRGVIQGSFYLKGPWFRGWMIMLSSIAAAFLGYVLPWGQISFWGATVIINLLRVLPLGNLLVIWLWGGFYVSFFTCRFFFSLHFLIPFLVLVLIFIHLILLHFRGRRRVRGLRRPAIKIKFVQLFLYKDLVNLSLIASMWIWALNNPDWSSDPINFFPSDISSSPIHIQPEWYFLHLYAVLRSIPNKLGGLIGFTIAILFINALLVVKSLQPVGVLKLFNFLSWSFAWTNLILIWLGSQAVEFPFILMGQVAATFYFILLIFFLSLDYVIQLLFL